MGTYIQKKYLSEKLNWHGYDKIPLSTLIQCIRLMDALNKRLEHVNQPIILLHALNDHLIHIKAMKPIIEKINSEDKTLVEIHEGGHLVLLDRGCSQALKEIEEWLNRRI